MIKFFRRIRRKLLSENKVSKYLIYAVGEIILVIVGILIALQINNKNIQSQDDQTEQIYLIALQGEFKTNEDILDKVISLNNEIIMATDKLLSYFDPEVFDTIPYAKISEGIVDATAEEIYYNPSTGVLTEIISSGKLKLIKNLELKQRLASFGNTLEFVKHQEKEVLRHRHLLEDIHVENGSVGRMFTDIGLVFDWKSKFEKANSLELFNSMPFENRLLLFRGTSRSAEFSCYQPLKEDIKDIIELIGKEIKNN
jgi:hypothetical protein